MSDQILQIASKPVEELRTGFDRAVPLAPLATGDQGSGTVRLMNVQLNCLTQSACIDELVSGLRHGHGGWVITVNVDHLRRCWVDERYEACVREADLRVADGMPLIWASRLQRTPLPERVAGSDLILSVSHVLAEERRSIFLLGGDPGTAEAASKVLKSRCPGLRIAGTYCPPLGFENDPREMQRIAGLLGASRADMIFVALGSPKQEYLIQQMRLLMPNAWWMGVGISFSFVCGQVKRAPRWMQRSGLEWVHRLMQEPKRLLKRYIAHCLPFVLLLVLGSAFRRLR